MSPSPQQLYYNKGLYGELKHRTAYCIIVYHTANLYEADYERLKQSISGYKIFPFDIDDPNGLIKFDGVNWIVSNLRNFDRICVAYIDRIQRKQIMRLHNVVLTNCI